MARPSDPKKLAVWRERFERFSNSGLGVAQFCARERVSVASFDNWRKKLGHKGRRRRTAHRRSVFQPVAVVPAALRVVPGPSAICIWRSPNAPVTATPANSIMSTPLTMLLGGVLLVTIKRQRSGRHRTPQRDGADVGVSQCHDTTERV